MPEYSKSFESDEAASGFVLRQWYMKFHPTSWPLQYHSAADLEQAMGDQIRSQYPGMPARALHTCLKQRLKSVSIDYQVGRTWVAEYASKSQASSSSSSSVCLLGLFSNDRPQLLVSQMLHPRSGSRPLSSWISIAAKPSRRLVEIGIELKYLIWVLA